MTEAKLFRGIPTLDEFLGDKPRVDDFAEWARRMLSIEMTAETPRQLTMARLIRLVAIAAIEGCAEETRLGREPLDVFRCLARAMGVCAVAAVASAGPDEMPWRELVAVLRLEFTEGAKIFADQCQESREQ